MKVDVQKSFEKDVAKIQNKKLAANLFALIDRLEKCTTLSEIKHVKKMAAKGNYFRIRVGNYRLGLKVESESLILLRFMNRKEIYRYFP